MVELSVVIPVFNEEGNIQRLHTSLDKVLKGLKRSYEILFIDDGSTDGTVETLKGLQKYSSAVKIVKFRKSEFLFSLKFNIGLADLLLILASP